MPFGKEVWQVEGSGEVLCARGYGIGPGARFLCDVDQGGLYEEPKISFHVPGILGRPEGAVVVGRDQDASEQVGGVALGCRGFTRYLRLVGKCCIAHQYALWE